MQEDPFVQNGVFVIEDVSDWTVYVDTRRVIHARTGLASR
jgi:hypothetical protein